MDMGVLYHSIPVLGTVHAGFPNIAENYIDNELNLHKFAVTHPVSTFFLKVEGDSMLGAGIYPEDILVVDRSLEPRNGSVVVAFLDGEFTLKRYYKKKESIYLIPANKKYKPIKVEIDQSFEIWGVATYTLHNLKKV
ncbi:MAG: translesion error-prone DNA polymerase V autoproteolytic subunit [Candidatus Dojkabacteria bacterium]